MEIAKINEVVDKSVLQTFYAKLIPINEICTIPGSINIIDFNLSKLEKIKGMISDLSYNQTPLTEQIDSDAKCSIIFNENLNFTNKVLILKNAIVENEYYVVENINTTFSPEKLNEVVNIAVCQKLEDYINNKKFIIFPNVITEPLEKVNIKIRENFLFQKAFVENKENLLREIKFIDKNFLSMICNPIEVNEDQTKVFMTTLSKFGLLDIRDICIGESDYSIYYDNQYDNRYKEFFKKIMKVYENQNLIMSGFANKTKEEVEEFKKIYSGTNAEEYVNYELSLLRDNSLFDKDQVDLLILMCSGFLKSTFCVSGGFATLHKYILPFYFDMQGGVLYLKSEFYELREKPQLWKIEEDLEWKEEQLKILEERRKKAEEERKRRSKRGEGRKR
ncbi:hypothetical protein PR244_02750 [Metamycoplasma hyosynoviae]|uniref:hypothetical protein n=1 Tax=Metamycoplasma hyosynoviae TaxID=29559 RepID=UPI002358A5BE|nr:hypothetical protein [Metamycoplasma hyosynoviae]MDC8919261.1 hypothetical protein [Metamycoplasma hyosynoviae]